MAFERFPSVLIASGLLAVAPPLYVAAQKPDAESLPDPMREPADETTFWSRFIDPEDGYLDVTAGSEGGSGFLPLLIPFKDPTIGGGLTIAGMYFHAADGAPGTRRVSNAPPSTTFGGAAFSSNDSWAVAGGHAATLRGGALRYLGGVGTASVNLKYYGIAGRDSGSAATLDSGLGFTIDGDGLLQQFQGKIGASPFMLGMRYSLLYADTTFQVTPDIELALGRTTDSSLSAFVNFDTRDNSYTPNEGTYARASVGIASESLGGDFEYARLDLGINRYVSLVSDRLVLGLRAEYQHSGDGTPFYMLPWVSLRGVPALRYLGSHALTLEVEPRWKVNERWSLLAFAGTGRAAEKLHELDDASDAYSYGVGFRYLIARRLGLGAGLDFARGPEDSVVSITVGSAWGL